MPEDLQPGTALGRYEVLKKSDSFGLGAAYVVLNRDADRKELMRLLPEKLSGGVADQRFTREAKILRKLDHPKILQFYDIAEIEGRTVLTMELPEGRTLQQVLQQNSASLTDCVGYLREVLAGLEHAHKVNIVHRCIAPANIHVLNGGSVKIGGFAFAREDSDPRFTVKGFVIGFAEYLSPEQAAGGSELDARSDLYSVAAVLYEAVTGRPPFETKNYFKLLKAHLDQPAVPPSQRRPELPKSLDQVILRGLAKAPGERYQTADEFRSALEVLQSELSREAACAGP